MESARERPQLRLGARGNGTREQKSLKPLREQLQKLNNVIPVPLEFFSALSYSPTVIFYPSVFALSLSVGRRLFRGLDSGIFDRPNRSMCCILGLTSTRCSVSFFRILSRYFSTNAMKIIGCTAFPLRISSVFPVSGESRKNCNWISTER